MKKKDRLIKQAFINVILKNLLSLKIEHWGRKKTVPDESKTPIGKIIRGSPRIISSEYSIKYMIAPKNTSKRELVTIEIERDGDFGQPRGNGPVLKQKLHIELINENDDSVMEMKYDCSQFIGINHSEIRPAISAKYRTILTIDDLILSEKSLLPRDYEALMYRPRKVIHDAINYIYRYDQDKDAWLVSGPANLLGYSKGSNWFERYKFPWNRKYQYENPIIERAKNNTSRKYPFFYLED